MRRKNRLSRTFIRALVVTGLVAVSIPASVVGGAQTVDSWVIEREVMELSFGDQDSISWGRESEDIALRRRNDCTSVEINGGSPTLLDIRAVGEDHELGLVKDGLGVQTAEEGSGEPCGRADAPDQAISVKLLLGDPYYMTKIDLDLELKFGARVNVSLYKSGNFVDDWEFTAEELNDPGSGDDGPDSKDGDNYRVVFIPGDDVLFDEVVITPLEGAVSLEGGADDTDAGKLNEASNASQFQIVRVYDGRLTCEDEITVEGGDLSGIFRVISIDEVTSVGDECAFKYYDAGVDENDREIFFVPDFVPDDPEDPVVDAVYTAVLTAENEPLSVVAGTGLQTILLDYDQEGGDDFEPLQMCTAQPNADFSNVATILPTDESWCFYRVDVTPTGVDASGNQLGTEVWYLVGIDDPNWSFK